MLYINETWPLPKPNKGKHLQLRLANVYDFQSVMMVSADVYFGYDYLPYVYNKWILESKLIYISEFRKKNCHKYPCISVIIPGIQK